MRAWLPLLSIAFAVGCGQDIDHPKAAAACDPRTMKCSMEPLEGGNGDGSSSGGSDSGGGDAVATIDGRVIGFSDDFFEQGAGLSSTADVSADGRSGARVKATYDRTSFELEGVLKTANNWFLTEPAENAGFLPTLIAADTRSTTSDQLIVAVAPALQVDNILQSLGTARSTSRSQIVLRVIDTQGRSVTGVLADLTAEVTAYRTAGVWLSNDTGTDDSGLLLLGNVSAGSALSRVGITLRGRASARVEVAISAGAVTVATAVVSPK